MKAFNRVNKHGIRYKFIELPGNRTEVTVRGFNHTIVIDHPIDKILDGWIQWHEGMFIQDAFWFLTSSEREFLKTGITEARWMKMFPTDGEKNDY